MYKEDFHNDKNLSVSNWGPSFWYIIHLLAHKYTRKNKCKIYYFFKFLSCILPCIKCQSPVDGYPFYFKNNNIRNHMTNSIDMFTWSYNLHNYVNIKTGKNKFHHNVKDTYYMFGRLGIKYGHFINFLINLSQVCNKYKEEKCSEKINHIIANVIFIIAEIIPEFRMYIDDKYFKNIIDIKDTQKIINFIANIMNNIKLSGVYDLTKIDSKNPNGKCSVNCADKQK